MGFVDSGHFLFATPFVWVRGSRLLPVRLLDCLHVGVAGDTKNLVIVLLLTLLQNLLRFL